MFYDNLYISTLDIHVTSKIYRSDGFTECHMMVSSFSKSQSLPDRLANADRAIDFIIAENQTDCLQPVFKRYYLSDPANQAALIPQGQPCAVSVVGQAPLDNGKFALLVILQGGVRVDKEDGSLYSVKHKGQGEGAASSHQLNANRNSIEGYTEYWYGGASSEHYDSYDATTELMTRYDQLLHKHGCTLADNCMRTWLYVRDIDNNYRGVVNGRNDVFRQIGLTRDTHFIASTGIEGTNPDPHRTVTFDAYAVAGIKPDDISYLHAYTHLNPTADYGVAFERGTAVRLPGGNRRIIISGTASINNKGEIVYPGDIKQQTMRMIQNVKALLDECTCTLDDLIHAVVYLRDPSDYESVNEILHRHLSQTPHIIVHAPVCRPGWLIEMECMALI